MVVPELASGDGALSLWKALREVCLDEGIRFGAR
jgi:hypothetical protein